MAAERGSIYLGAYAVCLAAESVLLVRVSSGALSEAGSWMLPGGGVEFGEHPDDAVLRELREETGLTGRRGELLGVYSREIPRSPSRPRPPVHRIGLLYRVDVEQAELAYEMDGTTDMCAWIHKEDLATLPLADVAEFALQALRGVDPE